MPIRSGASRLGRVLPRLKAVHWILLGVALAALALVGAGVLLVILAASALDTTKTLQDFAGPGEARAFTSAHLPAPLPPDAAVESLRYERWTDWHFSARVRLSSAEAADRYLEQAKAQRRLDPQYCQDEEPSGGVRYFLSEVWACGAIRRAAPQVVDVSCFTR